MKLQLWLLLTLVACCVQGKSLNEELESVQMQLRDAKADKHGMLWQ